jgi:hypothetical protein
LRLKFNKILGTAPVAVPFLRKESRPIFLGNGHIAILGPVACFIPLCALIVAKFGALMLLFMLIPAICTPIFLYLRKKGTDELYWRGAYCPR